MMYREITKEMVISWRDLILCNFDTGDIFWVNPPSNRVKIFSKAISTTSCGYMDIGINGSRFLSHRVIWAMRHNGLSASLQIDHINCIRTDNRISNLRLATNSQNMMNTKLRSTNSSGYKGVWFDKTNSTWVGEVWVNKKKHRVGRFSSPQDAAMAVEQKRAELHGKFFRSE